MPQIAVPGTVRITVRQTIGQETCVNVWHVIDQVEGTPANEGELRVAFADFYENPSTGSPRGINENHHNAWRLVEVCSQRLTSVPYPDGTCLPSAVVGLEGTAPALPNQTAAVVQLLTGFASRRARGRIFLGGFHTNTNDEDPTGASRLTNIGLTRILNALADLDDGVNAAGGQIAVFSALDGISRPVIRARVTNKWGTQRRRQKDVVSTNSPTVNFLES